MSRTVVVLPVRGTCSVSQGPSQPSTCPPHVTSDTACSCMKSDCVTGNSPTSAHTEVSTCDATTTHTCICLVSTSSRLHESGSSTGNLVPTKI